MAEISPKFTITDIELVAGESLLAQVSIYSEDLDAPFFIEYRQDRDKFFTLLEEAMTALWDQAPIIITYEFVEGNAEVISVKRV